MGGGLQVGVEIRVWFDRTALSTTRANMARDEHERRMKTAAARVFVHAAFMRLPMD
ncbi:MAG: hypothetical protein ACTS8Z_04080 [Candidatus Limnocylindrales bacterium]